MNVRKQHECIKKVSQDGFESSDEIHLVDLETIEEIKTLSSNV